MSFTPYNPVPGGDTNANAGAGATPKSGFTPYEAVANPQSSAQPSTFKFPTVATPQDHAALAKNAKADAVVAKKESDKANSFSGILGNTLKGAGSAIASSEVATGKTLGQSLAAGKVIDELSAANTQHGEIAANLIKQIRTDKAAGKDTTRLEKAYNALTDTPADATQQINDIIPETQKTNLQALGDVGGIALDTLSAGTYGEAAKGAETGKLLKTAKAGLPTVAEDVTKTTKGFLPSAKKVAEGAAVGYGYDVDQNLQQGKTGKDIATPGAGLAFGAGIPLVTEGVEGIVNKGKDISKAFNPEVETSLTKALKPGINNDKFSSDLNTALPYMHDTAVKTNTPIKTAEDLVKNTVAAKKELWNQYQTILGKGEGSYIDGNKVADAISSSIDKRFATQNPAAAERIRAIADTYRKPIPVADAEEFLQSANGELNSYYAKNKVGQSVAAKDPHVSHVVNEANALRKELYSKLGEATGHDATELKKAYGALTNVQNVATKRMNVAARANPDSLGEQIGFARGAAEIAKSAANLKFGDAVGGAVQIIGSKFLKDKNTTDSLIEGAFRKYAKTAGESPVIKASANYIPKITDESRLLPAKAGEGRQEPIIAFPKADKNIEYVGSKPAVVPSSNSNVRLPQDTRPEPKQLLLPAADTSRGKIPQNGPTIITPAPTTYEKGVPKASTLPQSNNQSGFARAGTLAAGAGIAGIGAAAMIPSRHNYKAQMMAESTPSTAKNTENNHVISGIDISRYATDPQHEQKVTRIFKQLPQFQTPTQIDEYIKARAPKSGVTAQMIIKHAQKYGVDPKLMIAIIQNDSQFGSRGLGARTHNPGNVGNTGAKITRFRSWDQGVEAVARTLANYKG